MFFNLKILPLGYYPKTIIQKVRKGIGIDFWFIIAKPRKVFIPNRKG